jgi:hypothetical protein
MEFRVVKYPKVGEIHWLFRKDKKKLEVLGYVRAHHNGFFVIGSRTGSYYSGHTESWKDKWEEFLKLSFFPREEAIKNKLIAENWVPPEVSFEDQEIIDKINKGML